MQSQRRTSEPFGGAEVKWALLLLFVSAFVMTPLLVWAHCDTMNGPVATAAREALKKGDVEEISLAAYRSGGAAKEVAENYFMETAVRLHRAAEGFPFTGLNPAQPLPPDIGAAEKALETGNLKPVHDLLSTAMKNETEKCFQKVLKAGE